MVAFNAFGASSLDLVVSVWGKTPDYWDVYFSNMEAIKEAFEQHKIEVPYAKRDVYHHYPDGVISTEKVAD